MPTGVTCRAGAALIDSRVLTAKKLHVVAACGLRFSAPFFWKLHRHVKFSLRTSACYARERVPSLKVLVEVDSTSICCLTLEYLLNCEVTANWRRTCGSNWLELDLIGSIARAKLFVGSLNTSNTCANYRRWCVRGRFKRGTSVAAAAT